MGKVIDISQHLLHIALLGTQLNERYELQEEVMELFRHSIVYSMHAQECLFTDSR